MGGSGSLQDAARRLEIPVVLLCGAHGNVQEGAARQAVLVPALADVVVVPSILGKGRTGEICHHLILVRTQFLPVVYCLSIFAVFHFKSVPYVKIIHGAQRDAGFLDTLARLCLW